MACQTPQKIQKVLSKFLDNKIPIFLLKAQEGHGIMSIQEKEKERKKMKIGDFVFAEYDNGEIVNGEVIKIRNMVDGSTLSERVLVTVKAEQGYRSIYLDKCVSFDMMESSK